MPDSLSDRLEAFGRRHFWLTVLAVTSLAALAMILLLSQPGTATIVYEAF